MTPPIGDSFPQHVKEQLATENFKLGAVIKIYCGYARKEKRFIVLGEKYDKSQVALVYINSELNKNVFPTKELQNQHILFSADDREYLDNDSYIDCTDFITRDSQEILDLIKANTSVHLGAISDEDYKTLRHLVCDSRLIPPSKKKAFGLFLK